MPSTLIENLLIGLSASDLTDIFLITLLIVFAIAVVAKWRHQMPQFTNYAPTLLTSLGILGTFAGIIIGLLAFNTADIDASIGPLLSGLKTAFISSLAGMLLSIIYKAIVTTGLLIPTKTAIVSDDDISSIDFYKVMKEQVATTELLRQSIAGDEDSSLISLIKLQRADANDQHRKMDAHLLQIAESATALLEVSKTQQDEFKAFQDRLWIKLQDFADMMSKSATEQVVEALKQSISDFNTNLTEQFGDNFKELNLAVGKLVEWQGNYKEQLQDMSVQYAQGVEAISATQASLATISEDAKTIPDTMTNLKSVMEVNQHQITELDRHLGAFKDIRDKAVEAVPEIRSQIDGALEGAKAANDELAKGILASSQEFQKVINEGAMDLKETVGQSITAGMQGVKAANDELAKGLLESGQEFQKNIIEGAVELKDNVGQASAALSEQATATANSSEEIKDQFSSVITDINSNMRNLVAELQEGGANLSSSYKSAAESLILENGAIQKSFSDGLSVIQNSLSNTIEQQANEHRRQADRVFSGLEKTIGESLQNTGESVERQVEMIDKTMGVEITKVMESMGSALVSISGQFTNDYKKLVDEMNQVVRSQ